ncbi:unnamed protein product [Mytilus coruscus]|uniref:Uncharacterized protein n=1 Tax=Mytilus coruscus TaxID=42192 RepID=A0A6J8BV97_MYTCO|nr:unnamed protein product [Mytilus coruscus]
MLKFKTRRSKLNWKKITTLYQGVNWKDIMNTKICAFQDIENITKEVFPIERTESCIKVCHFTGDLINGKRKAVESHPKGRICLSLWCRSPRGYADLRASGFVVLPSSRLLQYFKNSVNQVSRVNKEMLSWMLNEAKNKNIPLEEYEGGMLLDEMSIESDIQFSKKGGGMRIIGFTDVTEESKYMQILRTHKDDDNLATHALQG